MLGKMTPKRFAAALVKESPDGVAVFMMRELQLLIESGIASVAPMVMAQVPAPSAVVAIFWLQVLYEHAPFPPMWSPFGHALLAHIAMTPQQVATLARSRDVETPEQALRGWSKPRAVDIAGLADALQNALAFDGLTEPMARHFARVVRVALPLAGPEMGEERVTLAQAAWAVAMRWSEVAPAQTAAAVRDEVITLIMTARDYLPTSSVLWASNGVTLAGQLLARYRARGAVTDLNRAEAYCTSAPLQLPDAEQRAGAYGMLGEILLAQFEETMDPAKLEAAREQFHEAVLCAPAVSPLLSHLWDGVRRVSRARKRMQ